VAAPLPVQSLTETEFITFYTVVLDTPITVSNPPLTIQEFDVTVTLESP